MFRKNGEKEKQTCFDLFRFSHESEGRTYCSVKKKKHGDYSAFFSFCIEYSKYCICGTRECCVIELNDVDDQNVFLKKANSN